MSAPLVSMTVGVVVERRKSANKWIDFTWRATAVLPGHPAAGPWTLLSENGDVATFYAGSATIGLYRSEAERYAENLAAGRPSVWVRLRPAAGSSPFDLVAVTADPVEGESFTEVGDDLVDAVSMPEQVRAALAAFVAEHHVDRPFEKRQRDRADPEALARRDPAHRERDR